MSFQGITEIDLPAAPARLRSPARAAPRPIAMRFGALRIRGIGRRLLVVAVAVAGLLVLPLAGAVALVAVALAGPFLVSGILAIAFVLIVAAATGASG